MIVSTKWLKEIIDYSLTPEELESGLTSLGLECTYKADVSSFSGIVVGKILSVSKVEDSDHLNLCKVDIGETTVEIVCGANNVEPDILVPVALPGATLDNGNFTIKKAKIRGVVSNGMICSEKELGISSNHKGIMIFSEHYEIGSKFTNSKGNDIVDIDLTPNRGDCFSHLGVAREIALLENISINQSIKSFETGDFDTDIQIEIDNIDDCPRYAARVIKGVNVKPSPDWLREKIESIGHKSINNIVDAANYILFHFGHPMHTFDLDKIKNNKINVKKIKDKQNVMCLDGVTRSTTKDHLLICDGEKPIAIAGIMGLENSSVKDNTTNILIESAYFNPITVRKGAKQLDLSTDASKRFERDTDINMIIKSLDALTGLICEIAGGEPSKNVVDIYPKVKEKNIIDFDIDNCNALLGTSLNKKDMINILNKLSLEVLEERKSIKCIIPSYRNDLERSVDLYEEIARVYGYDNIPIAEFFSGSYSSLKKDKNLLSKKISNMLSNSGFNEHFSNSLLSEKEMMLFDDSKNVEIANPLSSDMQFLRNSIIPGLIKAVEFNLNHGNLDFKLFEVGEVHKVINTNKTSRYIQNSKLGIAWCCFGNKNWKNKNKFDFFDVKGEIDLIFKNLDVNVEYVNTNNEIQLHLNKKQIGFIKTMDDIDSNLLKNKSEVFFAEINIDQLKNNYVNNRTRIVPPSQFPSIYRDISILISKTFSYSEIKNVISNAGGDLLKQVSLFDLYVDKDIDKDKHSLSISLEFASNTRTLKDKEIDDLMDRVIQVLKNNFKITQR